MPTTRSKVRELLIEEDFHQALSVVQSKMSETTTVLRIALGRILVEKQAFNRQFYFHSEDDRMEGSDLKGTPADLHRWGEGEEFGRYVKTPCWDFAGRSRRS